MPNAHDSEVKSRCNDVPTVACDVGGASAMALEEREEYEFFKTASALSLELGTSPSRHARVDLPETSALVQMQVSRFHWREPGSDDQHLMHTSRR